MMISNFSQAQVTPFGGVLVIFGFSQHPPLDVGADVFIFYGPDVLRQWCAVTVSTLPYRMLVRILTMLDGLCGQTSVIPFLARRCDGCLEHHWLYFACAVQRAVLLASAVTWPPTAVIFANSPPPPPPPEGSSCCVDWSQLPYWAYNCNSASACWCGRFSRASSS